MKILPHWWLLHKISLTCCGNISVMVQPTGTECARIYDLELEKGDGLTQVLIEGN